MFKIALKKKIKHVRIISYVYKEKDLKYEKSWNLGKKMYGTL